MSRVPMTVGGEKALRDELDYLKSEKRPRIIKDIATAREHGDLKENAEYHAAREEQSFAEGRIQELESKLSNAQVIDVTEIPYAEKVIFGTTVQLINCDTDEQVRYQIVGDDEADIKKLKISFNSPIAKGLIGKHEGEVASIQTPKGVVEFEVDKVEHI
jgi:transcription elongation factor GreA